MREKFNREGFFCIKIFVYNSTPGSHTREEPLMTWFCNQWYERYCLATNRLGLLPGSGANVGAPHHPCLAIGSTSLFSTMRKNPLSNLRKQPLGKHRSSSPQWREAQANYESMSNQWPHTHTHFNSSFPCIKQEQSYIRKPTNAS